jgi:hypothetical protein
MDLIKRLALRGFSRLLQSMTAQELLRQHARDLFQAPPRNALTFREFPQPPEYDYLQQPVDQPPADPTRRPIFITARFRSGSTFLWQLFRKTPGVTAFYEPLNERQWVAGSGNNPDPTHLGVDSYVTEYAGLGEIAKLFDRNWAFHRLYLDQKSHEPGLARYIQALIDAAPERAVLQFNRVDLRLPWLRAHFPEAYLLHLYRDPREQWISIVRKAGREIPLDYTNWTEDFGKDLFYTYEWCRDLQGIFPFLDPTQKEHPYYFHYALWRLSYLFGRQFADASIAYETLVNDLEGALEPVWRETNLPMAHLEPLNQLNKGRASQRAQEYAPCSWYEEIENRVEQLIKVYFQPPKP